MGFLTLLAFKEKLGQEIKNRSMVFQVSSKEEYALFLGLKLDYFYNVSYEKWSQINKAMNQFRDYAFNDYQNSPAKYGKAPLMGAIWEVYKKNNPDLFLVLKKNILEICS